MKQFFSILFVLTFLLSFGVLAYDTVEVHTFSSIDEVYDSIKETRKDYHTNKNVVTGYFPSGLYNGPHERYSARYVSQAPTARYHFQKLTENTVKVEVEHREDILDFYLPYHYYWR